MGEEKKICVWTHDGVGTWGYKWLPSSCGFQVQSQFLKQELPHLCPSCAKPIRIVEDGNASA